MESYSKVEKLLEILRILRHNFGYFTAEQISNAPAIYQLQNREVIHLLRETSRFRVNDLLTELNTNFLQANQKNIFPDLRSENQRSAWPFTLYPGSTNPTRSSRIGSVNRFDETIHWWSLKNDPVL